MFIGLKFAWFLAWDLFFSSFLSFRLRLPHCGVSRIPLIFRRGFSLHTSFPDNQTALLEKNPPLDLLSRLLYITLQCKGSSLSWVQKCPFQIMTYNSCPSDTLDVPVMWLDECPPIAPASPATSLNSEHALHWQTAHIRRCHQRQPVLYKASETQTRYRKSISGKIICRMHWESKTQSICFFSFWFWPE